ncbi:hypothetical protein HU200_059975 [Digitaria exilis]|uniref:Uncharacterized protein n=1 Tax=Digitaria exilis TaxID=1010633 RepID=A0A835DZI6_9POAL|nr:hypothetical protein HU200_059975 [Digitaria exilis]
MGAVTDRTDASASLARPSRPVTSPPPARPVRHVALPHPHSLPPARTTTSFSRVPCHATRVVSRPTGRLGLARVPPPPPPHLRLARLLGHALLKGKGHSLPRGGGKLHDTRPCRRPHRVEAGGRKGRGDEALRLVLSLDWTCVGDDSLLVSLTRMMGAEKEEQGAAAMAGRAPARDKSSFAVTCSLLSQYLKENKGGLHGLGGLGMAPPPAAGAFRPPTTMNLLSALDAPAAEQPNDAAKATTEEPKEHDQRTGENQRITAKAPYQANSPSGLEVCKQSTGEKTSWLGLGQEVTVKQEI